MVQDVQDEKVMDIVLPSSLEQQIHRSELEIIFYNIHLEKHGSIPKGSDAPTKPSLPQPYSSPSPLTIQHKLQLATSLLGDINHEQSQKQAAVERLVNALKISLEETEMRIVDLQKDAFAFKRDVVVPTMCVSDGVGAGSGNKNHPRATTFGSVNSVDRVVRYFQCKILSMDATVGKLRLELSHQRNKAQRIDVQLKQKEKAGSSFHYIDFHQLQIENKKMEEDVDEKTRILEKIKFSEENSRKKLLVLEDDLELLKKTNDKVGRAVALRKKHLKRLEDDTLTLKADIEKGRLEEEKEVISSSGDDHVDDNNLMDMIQLQANLYDLRDAIKVWERKVEIAELVSKNKNRNVSC